jgi:hypothetical protein
METIVTITMNPAIDKSSSVAQVMAERKLYCRTPRFEPGGGGVNVCRASLMGFTRFTWMVNRTALPTRPSGGWLRSA